MTQGRDIKKIRSIHSMTTMCSRHIILTKAVIAEIRCKILLLGRISSHKPSVHFKKWFLTSLENWVFLSVANAKSKKSFHEVSLRHLWMHQSAVRVWLAWIMTTRAASNHSTIHNLCSHLLSTYLPSLQAWTTKEIVLAKIAVDSYPQKCSNHLRKL